MDSGGRWWEMSNAASIRCPPGIKKCVSELEILLQKDRALHNCVRLSPWDVDLFFTPKPYVGSVTPFIIHAHVDQLAPLGLPFPMGVAMRRYRPLASDSWGTTTGYSYLICCHAHEAHLPPKPPPFLRGRGGSGVLLLWQPSFERNSPPRMIFHAMDVIIVPKRCISVCGILSSMNLIIWQELSPSDS